MNGTELSIITLVILILMILSVVWFMNSLIVLIRLRVQEKEIIKLHHEIKADNNKVSTDYSEKILNFTKMITTQVAILKFKTFVDGHNMSKVTLANVQTVAGDIAKEVKTAININNINFDDTLFTKEFYESYIIETSIITVKALLDKTIGED